MVKLGFIVEGATESIVLEHQAFFHYLESLGVAYVPEVINVEGNGNLLPHNIDQNTSILIRKGATHIFILTDLDDDLCITSTKDRIAPSSVHIVIIAVRTIESWFLADTAAMRLYLNDPSFYCDWPETLADPFDTIKQLRLAKTGKGFTEKKRLANTFVHRMGFSIAHAAQHPNCKSARYFLDKINEIAAADRPA